MFLYFVVVEIVKMLFLMLFVVKWFNIVWFGMFKMLLLFLISVVVFKIGLFKKLGSVGGMGSFLIVE